jgi:hypothetical protein
MTTFDGLVREVRQQLMGFTMNQESVSELAISMADTDTSFTCDQGTVTNLSRGIVEIDDELILVKAYDATSGVVSIMGLANGRGYEGTVPAAHAQHALVTSAPAFPRARIKKAINDTIRGLYPHLVVFSSTQVTKLAPVIEYELPADVDDVWYVVAKLIGPTRVWQPMPNWRYNPQADTSVFPSGRSIQLLDAITPGQPVKVVYAHEPADLTAGTDEFTATGYPERLTDLVVYGTCKRLLPALESARLQQQSVEATERAPLVPPASATRAAGMYASLYQERLEEERARMMGEIPNYQTYQGS